MTTFTIVFVVMVLWTGTCFLVFGPKRISIPAVTVLYILFYFSFAELMGFSKPIQVPQSEVSIIGFHFDEGVAIHIWILESEPRAYRLPWDIDQARKLREAAQEAEGDAGELTMRRGVPEGEPMFYAKPPEELPLK